MGKKGRILFPVAKSKRPAHSCAGLQNSRHSQKLIRPKTPSAHESKW